MTYVGRVQPEAFRGRGKDPAYNPRFDMRKHTRRFVVIALLAFSVPTSAQTRGVTAEDYFAFETLGDPHFSPDGSTIAFVVTTVDQKQNRRRSEIWSAKAG